MKIAIVDSGVHASHPQVGGRVSGFALDADGWRSPDYVDRIGHGTAVAAVIREKAPDAELVAIKVFVDALRADAATLALAIVEAARDGADVINLSLGTARAEHAAIFAPAVEEATRRRAFVVAARDAGGQRWLPGSMDGVIGVRVDWNCARDAYRIDEADGTPVVVASGYPREIPGVPRERNLRGLSFAVANATGFVAQLLAEAPAGDLESMFVRLRERTLRSAST